MSLGVDRTGSGRFAICPSPRLPRTMDTRVDDGHGPERVAKKRGDPTGASACRFGVTVTGSSWARSAEACYPRAWSRPGLMPQTIATGLRDRSTDSSTARTRSVRTHTPHIAPGGWPSALPAVMGAEDGLLLSNTDAGERQGSLASWLYGVSTPVEMMLTLLIEFLLRTDGATRIGRKRAGSTGARSAASGTRRVVLSPGPGRASRPREGPPGGWREWSTAEKGHYVDFYSLPEIKYCSGIGSSPERGELAVRRKEP